MKKYRIYTLWGIISAVMAGGLSACSSDENTVEQPGMLEGSLEVNVAQTVAGALTRTSDTKVTADTVRLYPEEGEGSVLLVIKEPGLQPQTRAANGSTQSSFVYKNWIEDDNGALVGSMTDGSKATPDVSTDATRTYKYKYAAPGTNKSIVFGYYQQANADINPSVAWQTDATGKPTGINVSVTAPATYVWTAEGMPADHERTAWQLFKREYRGTISTDDPILTAQNGIKEMVCDFTIDPTSGDQGNWITVFSVGISDCHRSYTASLTSSGVTEDLSDDKGEAVFNINKTYSGTPTEFQGVMRFIREKVNTGTLTVIVENPNRKMKATYDLTKLGAGFDNVSRLVLKMKLKQSD